MTVRGRVSNKILVRMMRRVVLWSSLVVFVLFASASGNAQVDSVHTNESPEDSVAGEEPVVVADIKISLDSGWNLVSIPLALEGDVTAHVQKLLGDASSGAKMYAVDDEEPSGPPSGGGSTQGNSATDGARNLWVYVTQPVQFSLSGEVSAATAGYTVGWHVLGVSSPTVYNHPLISRLWRFDAQENKYAAVQVGEVLRPGQGYWGYLPQETQDPFSQTCLPPTASSNPESAPSTPGATPSPSSDSASSPPSDSAPSPSSFPRKRESRISSPWSYATATEALQNCPFAPEVAEVVLRTDWTHRRVPAESDPRLSSRSSIVLHHTGTPADQTIQALEEHTMVTMGARDLPYHYIIAQSDSSHGEAGEWRIYQGKALPVRVKDIDETAKIPPQVHVAIMGTYSEQSPGTIEETQYGYAPGSPESVRQPPRAAVLQLGLLVSSLRSQYAAIEDIVPASLGEKAWRPGESTSPGDGSLHLVSALSQRFFGQQSPGSASEESEQSGEVSTNSAPSLLIVSPLSSTAYTQEGEVQIIGEWSDPDNDGTGLWVNGVLVSDGPSSFAIALDLEEGANAITLVARDESGLSRTEHRKLIYDTTAPELVVTPPELSSVSAESDRIRITGEVYDDQLDRVGLDETLLEGVLQGHFEAELPVGEGMTVATVWAQDLAGNYAEQKVGVYRDASGVVFVPNALFAKTSPAASVPEYLGFYMEVSASQANTSFSIVLEDETGERESLASSAYLPEGAGKETARFPVMFADLQNLAVSQLRQVVVEDIVPEDSELTYTFHLFRREDVPALVDIDPPVLSVSSPEQEVMYTNRTKYDIEGTVSDAHFRRLSVNNVLMTTVPGKFRYEVAVKGQTRIRLLAKDQAGNQTAHTYEILSDTQAPTLQIYELRKAKPPKEESQEGTAPAEENGDPVPVYEGVVYEEVITLRGKVKDEHGPTLHVLDRSKVGGASWAPIVLTEDGSFAMELSLKEGDNSFTLQAGDEAGNETLAIVNLTYDPLGPIVTQATEPPTEFLATKADLHMTLAWQAPTLFVDGSRIPRGTKIRYRVYRDKAFIAEVTEPLYEEDVPEWDRAYIYVVYAVVTGRAPDFSVIPAEAGIQGQAAENSAADGEEVEFVSDPSEATELYFAPLLAALPPGEFEPPSLVSSSGLTAALPKAAVAKFGDKYYTHMVYLVRGDNDQGDRIDYLRSEKSGARDSFSHLVKGVADPGDGWTITEVSIAARENKVVIAWVEKTKEREPLFRIRVSDSRRNGDSFQALPHPVVGGTAWTRDLDTALDHRNRHHMVWSEANKVYYALDYVAETDPETDGDNRVSVFDVKKRRVNRDVVRYKHNYSGEDCKDVCGCPKSVAESYTLGLEKREGQELGKYHTRIEETFVYQPSLHVDGDKITIAARQTRMFDNYTYVNPNWRGSSDIKWTKNLGPKVPGGRRTRIPDTNRYKWCPPPPGATAWQPGYRHAWKLDQYKCEPEIPSNAEELLRLESRDNEYRYKHRDREDYYWYTENFGGHEQSWYYYLYEGKWHEEDSLKVAQRPLNRGAWSEPKTYGTWEEPELRRGRDWVRMREQENVVVEEGFAVGTWKRGELDVDPSSRPEWAFANLPEYEETRQRWRISTVETFASLGPEVPEEECAQSDPHVASLPGRKLVGPSYPKTYTGPDGTLYLVYEKGDAFHANVPGGNPIYFRKSNEDGVEGSWSSPKQIAQGFLPDISVASDGEIGVVFYVPDADAPLPDPQTGRQQLLGSLRVTRSVDGGSNWVEEQLNLAPTKPAHWSRYDGSQLVTDESGTAYSDYYHGIPDVVSFEEMLFVAWVRQAQSTTDRDAIVTTRMARTTEGRRVEHKTVSQGVAGESVAMTSVVVNKFHIRIPSDGSEELSGAALASSTSNTNGASVHSGASTDTSTATSPAVVPAEAGIQAQTTSGSGAQTIRSTTHEALAGQTITETEAALGQSLPAEAFHNGVFSGVAPVQVALQTQAAGGWQELDGVEEGDLEQIALLVEIKELFGKALGLENRAERMRKEMEAQAGYYTEEERAKWEEIRQRMLAEAQEKTEQADALCEEVHKREGTTPRDKKDPCGDVRWQMVSREERVLATADYLTEEEKAMFCRDEWMCVVIGKPIALGPDGQGVDASLGSDTVIASAGAAIPASQEQASQQELLDKNFAYFASNQEVVPNNATGNYYWATKLRDDQILQKGGGEGFEVLQVEYQPDPLRKEETEVLYDSQYLDTLNVDEQRLLGYRAGIEHDAKFLVSFERVWAYTMGIAVAQYARRNETVNAHGAARWLCSEVQAVWGTQDGTKSELSWAEAAKAADVLLLGWPFSINTNGDGWRDARLVAGATAWAIHGLGAFMVSRAFRKLVPEEQQQFRDCYYKSLQGLSLHERVFTANTASGALEVSLMTAGWTAKGLENSETPLGVLAGGELVEEYDENTTPQALQERFLKENPRGGTEEQYAAFVEKERKASAIASDEKWDYYDILDAIGYYVDEETFNNYPPPKIRTFTRDGQGNRHDQELVRVLNYQQMLALQARSQAENVVTEHNLDTLSVLNHALEHVETIWSNESAEEIASRKAWLKGWRDRQQRGIFEVLWDDSVATEVKQPVRDFDTKELIPGCRAEAKTIERKGRVTTGGGFEGGFTQAHLIESEEVAIDNCSWLALSVNYEHGLPEEYKQKLAVCLQYTIDKFADYLPFGDNNQCYYGTHYFPNSFRDPYIEQSDQQELSYHLEASAGLVMGLLWFADAHPEHPSSDAFRAEAMMLWSGMQEFVRDHRFPYSSQRIVNLSTLLTSSTAIIWFIDVFDYLELQDEDYDRPLRPYDEGVDYEQMAGFPPFAFEKLQGMEYEAPANSADAQDANAARAPPQDFLTGTTPDGIEYSIPVGDPNDLGKPVAPPSPLLVSGQTAEGVLYTLVEDQALALLAAVSQENKQKADAWAHALLGVMRRESQNKAYFPFAVDSTTGKPLVVASSEDSTSSLNTLVTGTQGLVVYALSHYAAYSGGASKEVGDAIRHTLNRLAQEKSTSSGAAVGAGAGSPNARILDHLYLYFALQAVADNNILGGSNAWLTTWQQEVYQSLMESFWDGTSHRPKVSLPEVGITEADFSAASSLYTLFAMASGDIVRGQDALDSQLWGSTTKRSASGTVPNTPSEFIAYHRDAFARSEAAQVLALRAVSVLDPRLAQLASAKLSQAIASANSIPAELRTPAVYASLILASAPRGAFGVDGGDLPLAESNVLARLAEAELDVEDLKRLYVETVGALFAADYSHGRFDALVLRLSYVRFLESQLGFPEHPKDVLYTLRREFTPVIAQTVAELRNLCNPNVPSQVRNDRLEELETYLGLQCQTIQDNFVKLSTRRAGTPDANVAIVVGASDALVGSGKKAWADRHVAQIAKLLGMFADRLESSDIAYHAQDGVFGYTGAAGLSTDPHTTWKSLATQAPIEFFTDSPNDIEVRTKVRGYLKQAVSATLASVQGTAYYELRHVDPVAAFHPKSLTFWSREAIELRILTQQADAAQYLLADAPVEAPSVDLSGLANSRALRKFTHTYAESHVPILSQATKVPVYALHRMLRTGVLPQEMQQALVSAYPIHEDEAAAWLAEMITPGPGTQGGGFATKALGLALKHNLPGFLSGVGIDFVGALFSVSLNGEQTDAAGELNAQIQASAAEQDVAQKIQWLDAIGIEFDHEVATSIMLQWYPIAKDAILPNLLFRDDDYFSTVEELIAGKVKGFEPPKQYVDAVAVALEKGEEAPSSHLFDFDPQIWLVDHECPTLSELAEAAKVYQVEFRLEFHVPSRHCVVGTGSGERFSTPFLVALGLPDLRHASLLIAHTHVGATPPSEKDQEFISTLSQGPLAQENSLLIAGGTVTVYSASSIGTPWDILLFDDTVASVTHGLPTESLDSTTNEPPGSFVPEAKQNSWKAHEQRLQENLELYAPKLQEYQRVAESQMLDKTSEQSKQLARYAELVTTLEQLRNAATQYLNMFAVGDYLATADANVLAAINAEYGKQDTQRTTTIEELQTLDESLSSAFLTATAASVSAGTANIRYELPGDDSEQGTKQVDEDTCVDIIRWDAGKRHKSGYLQLPRTQFVSWTPGARSAEVAKSAPGFTVLAECQTANGTYTDRTYTRFFLGASAGFEPYYAVLVRKKDAPIASGVTAKGTVEVPKDVVGNPTGATTTSPLVTSTVTNAATELECYTGYGVTLEDELCLPKVVDSGNILSGLVQTAATDGAAPPSNNPLVRIAELMREAQAIRDAVAQISATTLEYYDVYTPEDFARATALVTQQLAIAKEKQTEANGLCLEVLQQRKITPKDPDKPCDDVPWQEQAGSDKEDKEKTIEEILADHEALGVHYDRQVATAMMKKGKVSLDDRDLPWFRSPTTILKVKAKQADWFEFSGGCLSLQEDCMSPGEELFLWLEEMPHDGGAGEGSRVRRNRIEFVL